MLILFPAGCIQGALSFATLTKEVLSFAPLTRNNCRVILLSAPTCDTAQNPFKTSLTRLNPQVLRLTSRSVLSTLSNCAELASESSECFCCIISLVCKTLVTNATTINMKLKQLTVMYPLRYSGASTCCHTMSGSHACRTYAISFMLAMTMARSSLSCVHISCAHLIGCCQPEIVLSFKCEKEDLRHAETGKST